jgi:hypothetical protein
MVVHPCSDLCLCSSLELQCLFAIASKVSYSPVMSMLAHWQKMITGKNPIDITSLVMHIAAHVGALENVKVTYLPSTEVYQLQVGLEHFVQGHLMREGPGNSLFICYPGYDREIELPCPRLSLYSVKRLTLQMDKKEQARRSVAGLITRGRARCSTQQDQAGPSQQQPQADTTQQPEPSNTHMSFEDTYEYYTQGGSNATGGSIGYGHKQGFYYPRYSEFLWSTGGSVDLGMVRLREPNYAGDHGPHEPHQLPQPEAGSVQLGSGAQHRPQPAELGDDHGHAL